MAELSVITTVVGQNGYPITIGAGSDMASAGSIALGVNAGQRSGTALGENNIDIKTTSNGIFIGNSGESTAFGEANTDYVVFKVGGTENVLTKEQFMTLLDIAKLSPDGSQMLPYLIASVEDLRQLEAEVKAGDCKEGIYYRQTADINMAGELWDGIGLKNGDAPDSNHCFKGNYNGDGHRIYNLKFTYELSAENGENELRGFIRSAIGATVRNLTVHTVGFDITPAAYDVDVVNSDRGKFGAGVIVGTAIDSLIIDNCVAEGTLGTAEMPCAHTCAGIVANIDVPSITRGTVIIKNTTNKVNVASTRKAAGVVGFAIDNIKLENVRNEGNIARVVSPNSTRATKDANREDGVAGIVAYGSYNSSGHQPKYELNGLSNSGNITYNDGWTYGNLAGQLFGLWGADAGNTDTGTNVIVDNSMPLSKNINQNLANLNIFFGTVNGSNIESVSELVDGGEYVYLVNNVNNAGGAVTPPAYVLESGTVTVDQRTNTSVPKIVDGVGTPITGTQIEGTTRWTYTAS